MADPQLAPQTVDNLCAAGYVLKVLSAWPHTSLMQQRAGK